MEKKSKHFKMYFIKEDKKTRPKMGLSSLATRKLKNKYTVKYYLNFVMVEI